MSKTFLNTRSLGAARGKVEGRWRHEGRLPLVLEQGVSRKNCRVWGGQQVANVESIETSESRCDSSNLVTSSVFFSLSNPFPRSSQLLRLPGGSTFFLSFLHWASYSDSSLCSIPVSLVRFQLAVSSRLALSLIGLCPLQFPSFLLASSRSFSSASANTLPPVSKNLECPRGAAGN